MNAKEAIELWYGCDTIEALSQHQITDMLNALVSRVEQLEAAQQPLALDGFTEIEASGKCSKCGNEISIILSAPSRK